MTASRFTDAQDLATLARMIQEEWRALETAAPKAMFPQMARPTSPVREGMLVQARPNATVRPADRATQTLATGVVTRVYSSSLVEWSPLAEVNLKLSDSSGGDELGTLWLGNGGGAVCTKPASGLLQKVGVRLYYDAKSGKHRAIIQPSPVDILTF